MFAHISIWRCLISLATGRLKRMGPVPGGTQCPPGPPVFSYVICVAGRSHKISLAAPSLCLHVHCFYGWSYLICFYHVHQSSFVSGHSHSEFTDRSTFLVLLLVTYHTVSQDVATANFLSHAFRKCIGGWGGESTSPPDCARVRNECMFSQMCTAVIYIYIFTYRRFGGVGPEDDGKRSPE